MNAIEIRNLKKRLGKFQLTLPSLDIPEGFVTGFIGENGAGKTTTIKLVMNCLFADSGSIRIYGKDASANDPSFKKEISYVGDTPGFFPTSTLNQLKTMTRSFYPNWDDREFERLRDRFQLDMKQQFKKLSRGQQKQFVLALALSHHPRLLLLDEPTANLDPLIRQDFLDLLQDCISREGMTVFLSSHITSDLDKVADYIVFLHKGRLLMGLTAKDELLDRHRIVKGDSQSLTAATRELLTNVTDNGYGFSGLTRDFERFLALAEDKNFAYGLPSLEDIFINYVKGEKK